MKKYTILCLLLCILSLSSCAKKDSTTVLPQEQGLSQKEQTYLTYMLNTRYFYTKKTIKESLPTVRLIDYPTYMDETGFFTTFKSKPKRVAVLYADYAYLWQLSGGKVSITVQESLDRDFLNDSKVAVVDNSNGEQVDMNSLLIYEPDLVILYANYPSHIELAELLRMYEIPVLVLKIDNYLDYMTVLSMFTTILNKPNCYDSYGTKVLHRIDTVLETINDSKPRPNVLLLKADDESLSKVKQDNYVYSILTELEAIPNCKKMDDSISHIFILPSSKHNETKIAQMLANDVKYNQLSIVKNKKYTILPEALFPTLPCQDWDKCYQYIANILYPTYFSIDEMKETEYN